MAASAIHQKISGAYVYEIIVDGVVRYVGKGTGKRVSKHIKTAKRIVERRRTGEKFFVRKLYNSLAKAISEGCKIEERIIASGLSDQEAFEREALEIVSYPDTHLWNTRNGGPGNTSEYALSLWRDLEFREKQFASRRARHDDAVRSINEARRIRWEDPEQRRKQSDAGKERVVHLANFWKDNPELKSEMTRAWWENTEYREKVTASQNKRCSKVGSKVKISKAMKEVWSDEERRQKMSEKIKAVWSDPEYRANQIAKQKARFQDPSYRAAHGARISAAVARKKCSTS